MVELLLVDLEVVELLVVDLEVVEGLADVELLVVGIASRCLASCSRLAADAKFPPT